MADSRRRRRRLGEQGRIEFRLAEEAEDIERFTDTMIRWKSRRYQETGARDMFVHQAYRDYYKRLAQAHGHRGGIVHLSALLLDGTPIAVHWGMHFRGRLYWIMPAFDREQWSQYAAGRLLLEDVIRWSYDEQVSIFDFTLGDEPFKLEWSERVMPLYAHEAGLSARGRAYLRCRAGITWLRQTVRKHPRLLVLAKRARSALSRRPRPELP